MDEFINSIPSFWQGVLASLVAATIFAIVVALLRSWFSGYRHWQDRGKKEKEALKKEYTEGNDLQKTHASLKLIFNTLRWLFIGNILWIAPEAIGPFIYFDAIYLLKFASLVCFAIGLRWVSFFIDAVKSK